MKEKKTKESIKNVFEKLNAIYDSVFNIQYLDVFDLIPGIKMKNSNIEQRTKGLKRVLKRFDKKYPNIELGLFEYQMNSNFKSNEIFIEQRNKLIKGLIQKLPI